MELPEHPIELAEALKRRASEHAYRASDLLDEADKIEDRIASATLEEKALAGVTIAQRNKERLIEQSAAHALAALALTQAGPRL